MVELKSLRSETPYGKCNNCESPLNENYECPQGCTEDPFYTLIDPDAAYNIAVEQRICPVCNAALEKGVCSDDPDHWPPEDVESEYYENFLDEEEDE